jgi:ABC-2 type transport system permease protein
MATESTSRIQRDLLESVPIFALTMRQFLGGKAIRVVALASLLPALFSLIYWMDSGGTTPRAFMNGIFAEFIAPTILPLITLVLATNAIGNEIEDRTMVYVVLKPISRLRIVLEKYAAAVVTAMILLLEGLLLTYLLAMRGNAPNNVDQLLAMAVGTAFGVIAYGALFLVVSLIVPRALLAGFLYSLLWETTFARFIPGVRLVSVRHFVLSIYGHLVDTPSFLIGDASRLIPAVLTLLIVTAIGLAIATWRLRTMNLE